MKRDRLLRLRKDLLGSRLVEAGGSPRARHGSVVHDLVDDRSGALAGGVVDLAPIDRQPITGQHADAELNRAGDDPLDREAIDRVGRLDHDGAGVLLSSGVNTVDGVDTGETAIVPADRQVAGQCAGVEHHQEGDDAEASHEPLSGPGHEQDCTSPSSTASTVSQAESWTAPRGLKVAAVCFTALVGAAMAFAIFEPIQVLPRIRLAPGYALMADDGSAVNSEDGRGAVTLYSFAPTDCQARCEDMFATMQLVEQRVDAEIDLGETEFRLLTVALDEVSSPQSLREAADRSGASGEAWHWIGGESTDIRSVVGDGFQRFYQVADDGSIEFDPGFVLVDGNGLIRGEYRYRTLATDADKFIRHIEVLADEIRYANGPAAVAYEAAHLFLCYP